MSADRDTTAPLVMFTNALFCRITRKVVTKATLYDPEISSEDECCLDLTMNSLVITKVQESNVKLEMKEMFLLPNFLFDNETLLTRFDELEDKMLCKLNPASTVFANRMVGFFTDKCVRLRGVYGRWMELFNEKFASSEFTKVEPAPTIEELYKNESPPMMMLKDMNNVALKRLNCPIVNFFKTAIRKTSASKIVSARFV